MAINAVKEDVPKFRVEFGGYVGLGRSMKEARGNCVSALKRAGEQSCSHGKELIALAEQLESEP